MISPAALDDLHGKHPVATVAGKWVALRGGSQAGGMVGPCSIHSRKTGATVFECWSDGRVCARCETQHG